MSKQNRSYGVKPKQIKAKDAVIQAQQEVVNKCLDCIVSYGLWERTKFAWSIVRKKNYHVKVEG